MILENQESRLSELIGEQDSSGNRAAPIISLAIHSSFSY